MRSMKNNYESMRLSERKPPVKVSLLIFRLSVYYQAESENFALKTSLRRPCPRHQAAEHFSRQLRPQP